MLVCLFRQDEFDPGDGGESLLYDSPQDIANRLGTIEGSVEVPATKFELRSNSIEFMRQSMAHQSRYRTSLFH